ncbi:MAG: SprT family zinc-dependent metalloprotease [Gaiellaceae bacterium]
MSDSLTVDDLTFALRRSRRRKTLGITIERDGELVLAAPADASLDEIERAVRQKGLWIYRKLAEREFLVGPTLVKEYVSGETFHYLGRSYRLRLVDGGASSQPLQLRHGWFELRRDERERGENHFFDWYVEHGQPWLTHRAALYASRVGVTPEPAKVQDLGYRWGSCGSAAINFHWRTMQLPPRIIDYIIVHELVHVIEPRHDRAFWRRVERAMPDFAERKRWLAERGGTF